MKSDMTGTVFNIQHFCAQDGPGIRTTVFLKGCPLRCAWCHNPESWSAKPEILYYPAKCIGCGACAAVCPNGLHTFSETGHGYRRDGCTACGLCASVCPAEAIVRSGREMSVEEVMREVLQDEPFYARSGGGMTVSGGEPLFQSAFALRLLKAAKENRISTAIETSGFTKTETLREFLPCTDMFLYDCKLTDTELHRRYTGADNTLILRNLAMLSEADACVILRCPVIPGVNDTETHLRALAAMPASYSAIREIQLEPYHPLGIEKARSLGKDAVFAYPDFLEGEAVSAMLERWSVRSTVPITVQ